MPVVVAAPPALPHLPADFRHPTLRRPNIEDLGNFQEFGTRVSLEVEAAEAFLCASFDARSQPSTSISHDHPC